MCPGSARISPFGVPWSKRTSTGGTGLGAQALSYEFEHGSDLLAGHVELLDSNSRKCGSPSLRQCCQLTVKSCTHRPGARQSPLCGRQDALMRSAGSTVLAPTGRVRVGCGSPSFHVECPARARVEHGPYSGAIQSLWRQTVYRGMFVQKSRISITSTNEGLDARRARRRTSRSSTGAALATRTTAIPPPTREHARRASS